MITHSILHAQNRIATTQKRQLPHSIHNSHRKKQKTIITFTSVNFLKTLPSELILKIMGYLAGSAEQIHDLSMQDRVCKKWRSFANEAKALSINQNKIGLFDIGISKISHMFHLIKYLGDNLRYLDLTNFHISDFSVKSVVNYCSHLTYLKIMSLNLSGSGLKHISQLKSLEEIDLSCCKALRGIPDEFGNLPKLKVIDLSYGRQKITLPRCITKIITLEKLIINNSFSRICTDIHSLKNLKELYCCWSAKIKKLPASIDELINLEVLDISGTNIKRLPSTIGHLKRLKSLIADCCHFLKISESIGGLSSLENLDLQGCSAITYLPESLSNLKNLKYLSLARCSDLDFIPVSFGELTSLRVLDISSVKLSVLNSSTKNLKLEELNCSYQNTTDLEKWIFNQINLKELVINHSKMTSIPNEIGQLVNLEKLNLNSCILLNQISEEIGKLVNLEELGLNSSHHLYQLPESLNGLTKLKRIYTNYTWFLGPTSDHLKDIINHTSMKIIY